MFLFTCPYSHQAARVGISMRSANKPTSPMTLSPAKKIEDTGDTWNHPLPLTSIYYLIKNPNLYPYWVFSLYSTPGLIFPIVWDSLSSLQGDNTPVVTIYFAFIRERPSCYIQPSTLLSYLTTFPHFCTWECLRCTEFTLHKGVFQVCRFLLPLQYWRRCKNHSFAYETVPLQTTPIWFVEGRVSSLQWGNTPAVLQPMQILFCAGVSHKSYQNISKGLRGRRLIE